MINNQIRTIAAEEIWLNYFNDILYGRNLINETERNKMRNFIASRCEHKRVSNKMRVTNATL